MFLCICVWECTGRCDVITLMVFYSDWSLNPDIKAVGCASICIERWYVGVTVASNHHSCSMGGHTNPHQDRTTTNEQNMNEWSYAPMFRRHALIYFFGLFPSFPFYFFSMWVNLRKHLPDPHLGLCISSWTWLIKMFMSIVWLKNIIIFITPIMDFSQLINQECFYLGGKYKYVFIIYLYIYCQTGVFASQFNCLTLCSEVGLEKRCKKRAKE